jgi:hypothetical protein
LGFWFVLLLLLLLLLSSGKVEEQCAREPAEEAQFTAQRCASLCKARVEPFLERTFFSGCYAIAVACLSHVLRGVVVLGGRCFGEQEQTGGLTFLKLEESLVHSASTCVVSAEGVSSQGDSSLSCIFDDSKTQNSGCQTLVSVLRSKQLRGIRLSGPLPDSASDIKHNP